MKKPLLELALSIGGRAVSAFGVLAISVVVSRQLTLAQAGEFFSGYAVLMGLAIAARAGQELRVLRSVAGSEDQETGQADFRASLKIVGLLAGSLSALIFLLWLFLDSEAPLLMVWAPLVPMAVCNITASYLKAQGHNFLGSLSEVGSISLIAAIWYLIDRPGDVVSAWTMLTLTSWAVALGWLLLAMPVRKFTTYHGDRWPKLLRDARYLWLVAVLSYLAQWGVVVIAALAMTGDAVAILNALIRLLAPLQFIVLALDFYLAPRFAKKAAGEIVVTRRRGIAASLLLAAPYVLIILIWPNELLTAVYGANYGHYALELRILIAGIVVQMSLGANGILLNMLSEDFAMVLSVVIRAVTATSLQLALIVQPELWIACASLSLSILVQAVYLRYKVAGTLRARADTTLPQQRDA